MPKLNSLTNSQLKEVLRTKGLPENGTKNEMVLRLTDHLGSDEIDLILVPDNKNIDELSSMKQMIESLCQTVKELNDKINNTNQKNSKTNLVEQKEPHGNNTITTYPDDDEEADSDENQLENRSLCSSNESNICQISTSQCYSVREIAETIPEYDPTQESSLSAEQFVRHIEAAMKTYRWNDMTVLLAVYSRLKGAARMWYDCGNVLFSNWHDFKVELLNEFGTNYDEAEINFKMQNATRHTGERMTDYCFRIHALGRRFNLSEAAIIRYAREGIRNRELQFATAALRFSTMKQFRETIAEYLANVPGSSRQTKEYGENKSNNAAVRNVKHDQSTTQPGKENDIRCYNCNERGHKSINCPQPSKRERCTTCQRTSHQTKDCPSREKDTIQQSTINMIADSDDTYHHVTKKITVNCQPLTAFIDSGSPRSLIRKTCSIINNQSLQNCYKRLSGFAGGIYVATKKIKATVVVDNNTFEVDLFVVEHEDIPENVLIGRDLIFQKGSRLVFENGSCHVENVMNLHVNIHPHDTVLQEVLTENSRCFADNLNQLGKCSVAKMEIQLKTNEPVNMKPYRVAFAKREIVARIIADLLECKIIRPSQSKYASPVVLVEKKNGEHRLCVDYRCLNKITIRTPFPMPVLEEHFAKLAGNNYFTTLDLRMGYHQIEMADESKQYTAFITTDGHYEYNRMPFGLVNAPAVFQRVMNAMALEMGHDQILTYLDDVVIPSKTVREGIERLRKFLILLQKFGLTLRMDKCSFLEPEIEYLGHIINAEGIKPGKRKVTAIQSFPVPKTITEVRRFLGLTGFFRKFVRDYSLISRPLTQLLGKHESNEFIWSPEQQLAFKKLVNMLTNAPILTLYDVNKLHQVHTDACSLGLAGVLLQSTDEKLWQPVMYFSRHCTPAEQLYSIHELEVLAIVETLERFRLYLLGKSFQVVTDCLAVVRTKEQCELKPRIARWWMKLQEFAAELIHHPGNRLAHVDAMSRAPVEPPQSVEPAGFVYAISMEPNDWIVAIQHQDVRAKQIVNVITGTIKSPEEAQLKSEYLLKNDRLYRREGNQLKLYVPKAVRWSLVSHFHDAMGHFAVEKTLARMKTLFWFPRMRKLVTEHINACIACCFNKSQRGRQEGTMHYEAPEPIPFRLLHMDHLGPFVKSRRGNVYILVITDAFTKFSILKPVRNTKTSAVINTMKEVISYFGLPIKIVTDRGTAFTSRAFEQFCKDNHIIHTKNAVRTPRANGQAERTNATILNALRTSTDDSHEWDAELEKLQWVLNSQTNSTTKFTPNELVFNFNINDAVYNHLVAAVIEEVGDQREADKIKDKQECAVSNIAVEQAKWKKRFDKAHSNPTIYRKGDLVVIRVEPAATGESRKLEPKYRGPYIVTKALGHDRYALSDVPGIQITNKRLNTVYASHLMKPWCPQYPEFSADDDENDDSDDDDGYHNTMADGTIDSNQVETT